MDSKSKTFIAVFVVIIMLGGALVPLTYANSEGVVVGQSTDDETGDFSFASLIEKIKEKGSELFDEIEIGDGIKLVPTNETMTADDVITIDKVEGNVTADASKKYTFDSKVVFALKNESEQGKIIFPALSTLILFPQGQDSKYEIVNQNAGISGNMTLISVHVGAKIVLFDKVFLVVNGGAEKESLKLLETSYTYEGVSETTSTFSYTKNPNGTYKLALWVGANSTIRIAESLSLHDNTMYKKDVVDKDGKKIFSKDGPDIQFNGTIITSADSISAAGSVMVNARCGTTLMQGHFVIDSAQLSAVADITSLDHWSLSSTVDVSISNIYMQRFLVKDTHSDPVLKVVLNNGTIQTGDITAAVSYDKSGTAAVQIEKYVISLTKEKDLVFAADSILAVDVSMDSTKNDGFTNVMVSDIRLTVGKTALVMEFDSATETKTYVIDASVSASLTVGQVAALMYSIESDGKDPVLAAKIAVNDVKLTLGDTGIKGAFSFNGASPVSNLTAFTSVSFSINNAVGMLNKKNVEKSYTLVKDIQLNLLGVSVKSTNKNNVEISVDELSLKGSVCKEAFELIGSLTKALSVLKGFTYDVTLDFEIKGVKATKINSVTSMSVDSVLLSGKVLFNGKDRELRIALENITGTFSDTDSYKLTVGKIAIVNNLSLDIFEKLVDKTGETKLIQTIASILGIGSAQGEIVIVNLGVDGKTQKVTADSLALLMKDGVKFREMYVKYSDNLVFTIDKSSADDISSVYFGVKIKCGNVTGHYINYDGNKHNFSITDNPETGFTVVMSSGFGNQYYIPFNVSSMFNIYSGTAKFDGGKIPFPIYVGKDAKFSANGLTAPAFVFESGCEKSGTVILDTDAFGVTITLSVLGMDIRFEKTATIVDGGYPIAACDANGYDAHGFKLVFDLSDLNKGTIEANKGNMLPVKYSNDYGFSMESKDGQTGTFTIDRSSKKVTFVDVECVKKTYTVSYADDFVASEEYRYGEYVEVTSRTPTKEGYDFLGWTDGTGTLYNANTEYDGFEMPARDVVLKPVFTKTVTPEVVMEGEDKTLVVDATDVPLVCVDVTQENWTKITIRTENSSVTFDKDTFDAITNNESTYVMFGCVKAESVDNDDVAETTKGKSLYAMKLYLLDDEGRILDVPDYSGYTSFQVTVNVHTDKDVKDFKVQYVNENGYLEEVGIDSYKKLGDGSYDVTFTVNHFSMYAVEPIYSNTVTEMFILVGLIIAIVLICVALAAVFKKKDTA